MDPQDWTTDSVSAQGKPSTPPRFHQVGEVMGRGGDKSQGDIQQRNVSEDHDLPPDATKVVNRKGCKNKSLFVTVVLLFLCLLFGPQRLGI